MKIFTKYSVVWMLGLALSITFLFFLTMGARRTGPVFFLHQIFLIMFGWVWEFIAFVLGQDPSRANGFSEFIGLLLWFGWMYFASLIYAVFFVGVLKWMASLKIAKSLRAGVIVLFVSAMGVLFIAFSYTDADFRDWRPAACRSQLRQVGIAVLSYAENNDGQMPSDETSGKIFRKLLEKEYLKDKALLNCPGNELDEIDTSDPEGVGYYIDPSIPEQIAPRRAIMADRPPWELNHDGEGVSVMFVDGHVRFLKPCENGRIANPYIDEDTNIYADTGDPNKYAWIRWQREGE